MIWPYVICAYVLTSLVIGLMFHLAAWFDGPVSPKPAELVVFFAVFSLIGIPLVLASLFIASFPSSTGSRMSRVSKGLVTKEVSHS